MISTANRCLRACENSNADRNVSRCDWFHRPAESLLPIAIGVEMDELLRSVVPYVPFLATYIGMLLYFGSVYAFGCWMDRRAERREDSLRWDEECRKSREARLARESRV